MNTLQLRIPPLVLVVIFAAGMAALASAVPAAIHIPQSEGLAIALVGTGAIVAMAGVAAFRHHKTTVNPFTPDESSALVTSGVYRFTRNPMYLGFFLALLGWSAYLSNWAAALLPPAFIAYMNRFQIQPEERALQQSFGPEFTAYTQSVRCWL